MTHCQEQFISMDIYCIDKRGGDGYSYEQEKIFELDPIRPQDHHSINFNGWPEVFRMAIQYKVNKMPLSDLQGKS